MPASGEASQVEAGRLVVMRDIRKSFGPVEVLHGVDLEIAPGEVHALAGENGAGKSTLIKILSGVHSDYSGKLLMEGTECFFSHPIEAVRGGIATIHQELSLIPSMSVADNLFLGRESTRRLGWIDFESQKTAARRILETLDLDVSPDMFVEDLPVSMQQLLEIGRALSLDAKVFVFDEPTSALNEREAEILFNRIVDLRCQGRGVIYITHRMEEIYRLADRITVLRDGDVVGTSTSLDLQPKELVRWMVGRDVGVGGEAGVAGGEGVGKGGSQEEVVLEVSDLSVAHGERKGTQIVDNVSFAIRRGEVLGLAGLQGSGISDVLHALFGTPGQRVSGTVRLCGDHLEKRNPHDSVRRGLVLLTNDRKALGLAPDLDIVQNASLASLSRFCNRLGWISRNDETGAVADLTNEFGLNAPSLGAPVSTLSGGNQQKVYLARWLLTEPKVLLLDEPTRGIDVGAKSDIYELMHAWVNTGMSILLITSEMDELLALSDRVLVMHRGAIVAEMSSEDATKQAVLAAAMGQVLGTARTTGAGNP